ncbi:MAG TPA: hypothetical protein PLC89_05750 [Haliscomenobacter sp.]|uniref:hypothetical protein n=1 Tax=Haliscomenobacter sp. TaxID=2717303 RepID=UPI002CFB1427|nr:hypothetical protein [Haliscomenobacter sp.]HOY16771.1 hypothetical protein [Haliscomenobacter sp.]
MKFPRISFTKGTTLCDLKKLYPSLQVRPVAIADQKYLEVQIMEPGVGILWFIFSQQEELIEFEILPAYQK